MCVFGVWAPSDGFAISWAKHCAVAECHVLLREEWGAVSCTLLFMIIIRAMELRRRIQRDPFCLAREGCEMRLVANDSLGMRDRISCNRRNAGLSQVGYG